MRIRRIACYPLPFAFVGGGYKTSYGARQHLNNLVLVMETSDGGRGFGEIAQLTGNSEVPSSPEAINRFRGLLGRLIGKEAGNSAALSTDLPVGERNLRCATDTACLDLLARAAGQPLYNLLGGSCRQSVPCYFTTGQGDPIRIGQAVSKASSEGYRIIQIKVGSQRDKDIATLEAVLGAAAEDALILADANGGWTAEAAREMIAALADPRLVWEEPCPRYEDNRVLADKTGASLLLDQCLSDIKVYADACHDGFAFGVGLKPSIQGGLGAARTIRDLCLAHGLRIKVDDSWVADVGTSGALHLAMSIPDQNLISGVDMRLYFEDRCAPDGPVFTKPHLSPSQEAGLGLTPNLEDLGPPLIDLQ